MAVEVTPREDELQVVDWLRRSGSSLDEFTVQHLERIAGSGGEYEFDAVARLTIFGGASVTLLVECKRYNQPVEREKVLALWAKCQDVSAHKAMMFATCGFQSGALTYAASKGIATITFTAGSFLYETRSMEATPSPPPWAQIERFAGDFIAAEGERITGSQVSRDRVEPIRSWLAGRDA